MSIMSKLFALFPTLHFLVILSTTCFFILERNLIYTLSILFSIYLFPLISFRILMFISPIKEGKSDILKKEFSPWWAAHQIQMLFVTFPFFESALRICPGLFSLWLRAWGSKIGSNIYWTPTLSVYDRNLLHIGNNVIFGEKCNLVSHVITAKNNKGLLYIKKIKIEDQAFIGAGTTLSPGTFVEKGVLVKASSEVLPNSHITKNEITRTKI